MKNQLICMITILSFVIAACSGSGRSAGDSNANIPLTPKSASINECPKLQGEYKNTQHLSSMTIYEKHEAEAYRLTLGDGAQEIIVDGKSHPLQEGATYQSWCEKGILFLEMTMGNSKSLMKNYFSQLGILIQETSGAEGNSKEEWQKIK